MATEAMYKKAIQINHEFLADESVNRQYGNIPAYQNLLLEKCGLKINPSLTNHFKHSITKLRLIMMYKQTSPITAAIKKLAFLPILIIIAITFSSRSAKNYGKHTYQLNAYTLQRYENLIQSLKDAY